MRAREPSAATLTNALAMGSQRALDGFFACRLGGERDERLRLVALLEGSVTEERHACGPGGPVVAFVLGAQLSAEGDQLAHVRNRRHRACGREANEALRVQVVAEQKDRVPVAGREQARAAVVDEVALVDGLHGQGEARVRERREDRLAVSGTPRSERSPPERPVALGVEGDLLPEVRLR